MNKTYKQFWMILVLAFVLFFALSAFDSIKLGNLELKSSGMIDRLMQVPEGIESAVEEVAEETVKTVEDAPKTIDETPHTILFIGDSMLEGLYPRLAAYAEKNGHTLYAVIWYSSTSEVWGETTKLAEYIEKYNPTYIFVSLGANELFVRNIAEKRDKYVKNIISQIGTLPYVWIGPPNWKEDTGINALIAKNTKKGTFFVSNGMHFDRAKDGAHPTRKSACEWMDSVARWMPLHAEHPIKMDLPEKETAKAKRVEVLQPKK